MVSDLQTDDITLPWYLIFVVSMICMLYCNLYMYVMLCCVCYVVFIMCMLCVFIVYVVLYLMCMLRCTYSYTCMLCSLVPRPLFSVFICGGGKKGLVDLHRTFCSTDSQILGIVNRCWQLQRPFWRSVNNDYRL